MHRVADRDNDATTVAISRRHHHLPRVHRKVARYPFPSFPLFTISLSFSRARAFTGIKPRYANVAHIHTHAHTHTHTRTRARTACVSSLSSLLFASSLHVRRKLPPCSSLLPSSSSPLSPPLLFLFLFLFLFLHLLWQRQRFSTRCSRSREFDARRWQGLEAHSHGGPTIHNGPRPRDSYSLIERNRRPTE